MHMSGKLMFRLAFTAALAVTPALATTAPALVPEPSTFLLMGAGLAAAVLYARKKRP